MLRRSRSAIGPAGVPGAAIGGAYVTTGSRSVRGGVGIATTPPVSALTTRASAGSRKNDANCLSFFGSSMLKRSFEPVPTRSSLMSGLPMRCTCDRPSPWSIAGSGARRTVTRGRDVVAHMPIVAAGEPAASTLPVRVSSATGTSIAIEFTA